MKRIVCSLAIVVAILGSATVFSLRAEAAPSGPVVTNVFNRSIDIYTTDKAVIKVYTATDGTRSVMVSDLAGNAVLASIVDAKGVVLYGN